MDVRLEAGKETGSEEGGDGKCKEKQGHLWEVSGLKCLFSEDSLRVTGLTWSNFKCYER